MTLTNSNFSVSKVSVRKFSTPSSDLQETDPFIFKLLKFGTHFQLLSATSPLYPLSKQIWKLISLKNSVLLYPEISSFTKPGDSVYCVCECVEGEGVVHLCEGEDGGWILNIYFKGSVLFYIYIHFKHTHTHTHTESWFSVLKFALLTKRLLFSGEASCDIPGSSQARKTGGWVDEWVAGKWSVTHSHHLHLPSPTLFPLSQHLHLSCPTCLEHMVLHRPDVQ